MRQVSYSYQMKKWFFALAVLVPFIGAYADVQAKEKFTAGHIINKMNRAERYSYVAGLIEGLAYARYIKDGKREKGMTCIYDWFYKDEHSWKQILQTFIKFEKYPPGVVLYALLKKKCGA